MQPFNGKPLILWTVEAALNCVDIDRVFVSTDGDSIAETVRYLNHPKVEVIGRSPETTTDTASTESVMLEFADKYDFETIVLIQPTSPLLTSEDLTGAFRNYRETKVDSLLSVVRQKRFVWEAKGSTVVPANYDVFHRPRRQEFDGFLVENGAFYITTKKALVESQNRLSGTIGYYEMNANTYVEIDEPEDWQIAERLLQRRENKQPSEAADIKLFVTDVDGVLTDSGMYYSENGDELKKFNTRDGVGLRVLQENGIQTAIFTSEDTEIVNRRAEKLKIDHVFQGVHDKKKALTEFCKSIGINLKNIAFIGDDVNDTELLKAVGYSACPADAIDANRNIVHFVCDAKGGGGCVREFAEYLLKRIKS